MRNTVGISQKIKRAWLDAALDRLTQSTDEKELRSFLDTHLREELPGKESRAKASGIVLRIWSGVDPRNVGIRNRALAMLPRISGQERIWLHWGMTALAYPFFRDVAETVGRTLNLQDDISTAQVQSRLTTTWGDRNTSKEAAQKLVTSLVDWEVLRGTSAKGHFLLSRKMTTAVADLQLWLLEAMLSASASDEIEAQQLLRLPELFPFSFTVTLSDLRRHEGFNIHRQGLDMDMVSVRQVKVTPPNPPARSKKSKKEFAEPDQPTFFDDPNLQIPLNAGPNPGIPVAQVLGIQLAKMHRGNSLTLPEPVITLTNDVMNRLDQFVHDLKREFPMLSDYDFTLTAVQPTVEQTEVRKPIDKTIRIVLDRRSRQSEMDFLKAIENAQASIRAHGGTIHRVVRYPGEGEAEARRYELATSFAGISSQAKAECIRDGILTMIDCQSVVRPDE